MSLQVETVRRPQWTLVPQAGCHNVYVKNLLYLDHLAIVMLRFDAGATIHEHDAPHRIDVICLEGSGYVSVGTQQAPIQAGEKVRWPAGQLHRLWTHDTTMVTLMIEHLIPTADHPFMPRTI